MMTARNIFGAGKPMTIIGSRKLPFEFGQTQILSVSKRLVISSAAVNTENVVSAKHISKMPGMRILPFFGNMLSLLSRKDFNPNMVHCLWMNLIRDFGPMTQIKFPLFPPMILMTNAEDFKKLYRVTMDNPVRIGFYCLKKVRREAVENYFEKNEGLGLLVENHDEWWRVRSRIQTPMMRPKNIVKYLPRVDEVTLCFMDRIAEFQKKHGEMPNDFLTELYKWALESVALVALNRRLGCLDPAIPHDSDQMEMIRNVNIIFEAMNETEFSLPIWRVIPTAPYKRLKKAHDSFIRIVDRQTHQTEATLQARCEKQEESEDINLIETLLKTKGLTRKDVVTLILDMLFAGIDTTSHVIAFTLYLLAKNPKAQKRVQEEVDSILGDGHETLTERHMARLSFTKACVKESMRLFPIVLGQVRMLEKDTEFGGYVIPKGYQIMAFTFATSKDESLFPKAQEFIPERWARNQPLGPIHPFASLPFSHGPRMCVGRRIAEQEIYTFLARVMHRYTVDYKYADMKIVTKLICTPSEPLRFKFEERRTYSGQ